MDLRYKVSLVNTSMHLQVHTQVRNPLTTGLNACMICLEVSGDIIQYAGSCNCRPKLHIACLQQWFSINRNTCPICRHKYNYPIVTPSPTPTPLEQRRDDDGCLSICTVICILSMAFTPCCIH